MEIVHGRAEGPPGAAGQNFTGQVHKDRILNVDDVLRLGSICFSPGARTYWHSHGDGQILQVTSGQGRIAAEGESVQVIKAGDVIWTPPGEVHWHGADTETFLVHTAFSLGATHWGKEVTPEEYDALAGE